MSSNSIPPWRKPSTAANPAESSIPRKRPAPVNAQEEAWVAEEDRFVLRQAKRKAALRVKAKRPRPIDWLVVTLSVIDPKRNPLEEDEDGEDIDIMDPEGLLESLDQKGLEDLCTDIDMYLKLEQNAQNREYWQVCIFSTDSVRLLTY